MGHVVSANELNRDVGESGRQLGWVGTQLSRYGQVIRYLLVGGANTVIGYAAFAGLNYLFTGRIPYPYMLANVGANVFAITVAFFGYKLFVFRTRGNYLREYLRTYVVYGSSAVLGLLLLPLQVAFVGMYLQNKVLVPYVAQAITVPLVVLVSFFGHKKYSFRS